MEFCECDALKKFTAPASLASIETYAFSGCGALSEVTFSDSLKSVAYGAFHDCDSITVVNIGKNVTSFGVAVFSGCDMLTAINVDAENKNYVSVDGVLFNKAMTTLMQYPSAKSGEEYSIPETVTTLDSYSFFANQSLKNIALPKSVTTIGTDCFESGVLLEHIKYAGSEADFANVKCTENEFLSESGVLIFN